MTVYRIETRAPARTARSRVRKRTGGTRWSSWLRPGQPGPRSPSGAPVSNAAIPWSR